MNCRFYCCLKLKKNDRLQLFTVHRGYEDSNGSPVHYQTKTDARLMIEAITPVSYEMLKARKDENQFDYNSPVEFPTQLNLANFLNKEKKISEFVQNVTDAFNLEILQNEKNIEVNVKKKFNRNLFAAVDLDNRVNSENAEASKIDYPSSMAVKYKIDADEHGFYDSALTHDSAEVAVGVILARAHEFQRRLAVEVIRTGGKGDKGVFVGIDLHFLFEKNVHSAESVDHLFKALKVKQHIMIDRQTQAVVNDPDDGVNIALRALRYLRAADCVHAGHHFLLRNLSLAFFAPVHRTRRLVNAVYLAESIAVLADVCVARHLQHVHPVSLVVKAHQPYAVGEILALVNADNEEIRHFIPVLFVGNEPLLYRRLFKLLAAVGKHGLGCIN